MTTYCIPGRVELVGKHVDYAGGRSLTCAVDRAVRLRASPIDAPLVRVLDTASGEWVEVPMQGAAQHRGPAWGVYVAAVVRRMVRDFPAVTRGVELSFHSDLPPAAGLSSSSAIVIGCALALADANALPQAADTQELFATDMALAEYMGAIETGAPCGPYAGDAGVGVRGGAQDHVAIVCNQADTVGQFAYVPAQCERRIPWPAECVLAIAVSGVHASKTGNAMAAYNRASDALRALTTRWNARTTRHDATIADALRSGPGAAELLATLAAEPDATLPTHYLTTRLAQFREETEIIVPLVADALASSDFAALGTLVDRSMALAESALGNQVPETSYLARSARRHGALAASAFGAGFGGSVWAMVPSAEGSVFLSKWNADYAHAFSGTAAQASFFLTRPSAPARRT